MFFPNTAGDPELIGKDKGEGYNVHFAFNAYCTKNISDLDYIYACETLLFPIIREFKPDAILISCGFDSAKGDPLGGIELTPVGYSWMTHGLLQICPQIVAFLEGGYNLDALAINTEAVIETMKLGDNTDKFDEFLAIKYKEDRGYKVLAKKSIEEPKKEFKRVRTKLEKLLKPHWKCLNQEDDTNSQET